MRQYRSGTKCRIKLIDSRSQRERGGSIHMSNPGDYGQNQAGAPQWGAPQQGYNPNQTQGFDPNQSQGFGQGYPQYGQQPQQQPYGQPQQQWGAAQPGYGAPAPVSKPLPWTLRELILVGVGVLLLVFSFFPMVGDFRFGVTLWQSGGWILSVVGPVIAVALVALRPFIPVVSRIGSLSVDQFASVTFSVAAISWLSTLMSGFGGALAWAGWILVLLTVAGVVLTVAAPFIPGLREEFDQRPEEVAPRAARTTRVVPEGAKQFTINTTAPGAYTAPAAQDAQPTQQNPWAAQQQVPAQENPWAAQQQVPAPAQDNAWATPVADAAPAESAPAESAPVEQPAAESAPVEAAAAEAAPAEEEAPVAAVPAAQQPFWALVPEERGVVDVTGAEIFRVGPTAWALVIEDNVSSFVIRHDDGRTGTLNDVSGVVRN